MVFGCFRVLEYTTTSSVKLGRVSSQESPCLDNADTVSTEMGYFNFISGSNDLHRKPFLRFNYNTVCASFRDVRVDKDAHFKLYRSRVVQGIPALSATNSHCLRKVSGMLLRSKRVARFVQDPQSPRFRKMTTTLMSHTQAPRGSRGQFAPNSL